MKRPKRLFRRRGTSQRMIRRDQISITGEADYVVERAGARETRIVCMGPLVFFSTATGDAWVLDGDDHLALCLAVDGNRQPVTIFETPSQFGIEWTGTFEIDRDVMIYHDRNGETRTILGYPTKAILVALHHDRL
jgi:hypothetical protein